MNSVRRRVYDADMRVSYIIKKVLDTSSTFFCYAPCSMMILLQVRYVFLIVGQ